MQIKFRAWDPKHKGWIAGFNMINFHDYYTKGLSKKLQRYKSGWVGNEFILMQFTGLKDKNGKELYSGDIVEMEAVMDYPGESGAEIDRIYTGEVVIIPSKGACLKRPRITERNDGNRKWRCGYYKPITAYRSKVIGTIFENPELIAEG